jgi:Ca-activated chloride channel family protein
MLRATRHGCRLPMIGRSIVIALAAIAVGVAAWGALGHGDGGDAEVGAPLRVTFAYSPNQEDLLLPQIARFNREQHEVGGRRIQILGESVSSGEAEAGIARRRYRPQLWAPASSLWARLLEYEADADWVGDTNPSLARTPLVIALWKPEAQALGWPKRKLGFRELLDLATSHRGWAAYGLPTFGQFKLGHTNPDFSTSGLSFVTAQYLTASAKREGLTIGDVSAPAVRARVRRIEQSIVHYGDTSQFFLDQLAAHGPGYISAVAMEEVTMLEYDRTRPKGSLPLVAVYPHEGTFYFDNPLIALRAPWVTPLQGGAATAFQTWLMPKLTAELVGRAGYRPGNGAKPVAPVDRAHFVDPAEPRAVLGLPDPRVLAAIKRAWRTDRKPANVEIVVDVSGSMEEDAKLIQARKGLQVFLRQFSPRDRVGLVTFSDGVDEIVPLGNGAANRASLRAAVANLTSGGGTAVYDAAARGLELVQALHDPSRINAVVLLTDGQDNQSSLGEEQLRRRLAQQAESQERNIRVFTIAYGADANGDVLHELAQASGGNDYAGSPTEIAGVYRQISSYF